MQSIEREVARIYPYQIREIAFSVLEDAIECYCRGGRLAREALLYINSSDDTFKKGDKYMPSPYSFESCCFILGIENTEEFRNRILALRHNRGSAGATPRKLIKTFATPQVVSGS